MCFADSGYNLDESAESCLRGKPDRRHRRQKNRQESHRLRRAPKAMGRRKDVRLDQPRAPFRQGLRGDHQVIAGVAASRLRLPAHAQACEARSSDRVNCESGAWIFSIGIWARSWIRRCEKKLWLAILRHVAPQASPIRSWIRCSPPSSARGTDLTTLATSPPTVAVPPRCAQTRRAARHWRGCPSGAASRSRARWS